jgi:membrane-bound inhibitor of C-type lysozyme
VAIAAPAASRLRATLRRPHATAPLRVARTKSLWEAIRQTNKARARSGTDKRAGQGLTRWDVQRRVEAALSCHAVIGRSFKRGSGILRCEAGKTVSAVFTNGPRSDVRLTLSDGRELSLPQAQSASGARYANGDETFVSGTPAIRRSSTRTATLPTAAARPSADNCRRIERDSRPLWTLSNPLLPEA